MEKIRDIISGIPVFSGLDNGQLTEIQNIAVDKPYSKDQFIFYDNDIADGFYVVVKGRIKVFKISFEGKEQIFHILGSGEPFGEVPVFSGETFPANAQALTNAHCLFFSRTDVIDLISKNPSLALKMLAVLSRRLREFTVQVENLSLKEVDGRVAGYLVHISREQGTPDKVELHISKAQLASLLGTIPETLSRAFARLKNKNLILVNKKQIKILDRESLKDFSNNL